MNTIKASWLKAIALILIAACAFTAAFTTSNTLLGIGDAEFLLNPSTRAHQELSRAVNNALEELIDDRDIYEAKQELDELNVDYYIRIGDSKVSNTDDISPESYENADYGFVARKNADGTETLSSLSGLYPEGMYNKIGSDFDIFIKVQDGFVEQFSHNSGVVTERFGAVIKIDVIVIAIMLVMFCYMLYVCGRKSGDDELHMLLIDRMFVEFTAMLILFTLLAEGLLATMVVRCIDWTDITSSIISGVSLLAAVGSAALAAAFTGLSMSLTRNLKNKSFISRSLAVICAVALWRFIKKAVRGILRLIKKMFSQIEGAFGGKIGKIAIAVLVLYTLFVFWLGALRSGFIFLCLVAVLISGSFWISQKLVMLDRIKDGIFKIKGGEVNYKIEKTGGGVLCDVADAVNKIGDGISASVDKQVKAERMKSELITNVSHDLKTPLTSIINYSDLLCKEELTPSEANDYAEIIRQKADRLKKLTSDLFDISKVQSGNEEITLERIDAATLSEQAVAELSREIQDSGLEIETSVGENLFFMGDGRKLSRVFTNLIQNALKYSLSGTRIYITAKAEGENIQIDIKNIASYKMDFDSEEITERFRRGDESRTTEGSGLGLAIAKGYTEACGGKLKVTVDGDLFKVTLTFKAL